MSEIVKFGHKEYLNSIKEVDFSNDIIANSNNDEDRVSDFVKSSGLQIINDIIKDGLSKFSDQYFFEYSVLGTTLDPRLNKLFCFSGIQGCKQFKETIEKNVKAIIDKNFSDINENFFHNPEFFIAPTDIHVVLVTDSKSLDSNLDDTAAENKYQRVRGNDSNDFYVSNMTYERAFKDIISASKNIYEKNGGGKEPESDVKEKLINHYKEGLLKLKSYYDQVVPSEGETYHYLSLPLLAAKNTKVSKRYTDCFGEGEMAKRIQGIGSCFIYFKHKGTTLSGEEIFALYKKINDAVLLFSMNYMFNIGIRLQEETEKKSIKSAIAAIMSRNMSHNLGSHVFYYTRQDILGIYEKEKGNNNFKYNEHLRGIGWFLHYVQERQDFVANINSGDEYFFGQLNLKQDIIDEISPNAVDRRHSQSNGKGALTKNYLLENIVKSEKIVHKDSNVKNEATEYADLQLKIKYNGNEFSTTDDAIVSPEFYNINFAVQGGQQSRHAFLIMLENIIRNSAKHAFDPAKNKELVITIEIEVIHKDESGRVIEDAKVAEAKNLKKEYRITIYDNTQNAHKKNQEGANETTNLDNIQKRFKSISLIDKDSGLINRENKGIKEIFISILWLQGKDLGAIETYAKDSVLNITEKEGNIGFQFDLPFFETVLPLTSNDISRIINNEKHTLYASIYSINEEEIKSYIADEEKKGNTLNEEYVTETLKLRIPRLISKKTDEELADVWEELYNSKYAVPNENLLLFDREDKVSDTDFVKFEIIKSETKSEYETMLEQEVFIYFNNHLAKNEQTLNNTVDKLRQAQIEGRRQPIYESISGANQIFNILQKFQNTAIENKDKQSLYWNVLECYNTKILIIDERLSFLSKTTNLHPVIDEFISQRKVEIGNNSQSNDSTTAANKLMNKLGITLFRNDYEKELNNLDIASEENIYQNVAKVVSNYRGKVPKFHLTDTDRDKYKYAKDIFTHNPHVRETFLEQQNTYVYNVNEDKKIINSCGKTNVFNLKEGEKMDIDFFSIHVSLLDKIYEKSSIKSLEERLLDFQDINGITPKFTCVHSGRGGLSSKNEVVSFVPFSILQRCLEDSKLLLAEFFNNFKYAPIKKQKNGTEIKN